MFICAHEIYKKYPPTKNSHKHAGMQKNPLIQSSLINNFLFQPSNNLGFNNILFIFKCLFQIVVLFRSFVALNPPPTPLPSILKILRIYSYMTHGITLKALCARTLPRENNIDER